MMESCEERGCGLVGTAQSWFVVTSRNGWVELKLPRLLVKSNESNRAEWSKARSVSNVVNKDWRQAYL